MIQHLITVASTLSGLFITYGISKLYKKNIKPKCAYEEIEITEYHDIWSDVY